MRQTFVRASARAPTLTQNRKRKQILLNKLFISKYEAYMVQCALIELEESSNAINSWTLAHILMSEHQLVCTRGFSSFFLFFLWVLIGLPLLLLSSVWCAWQASTTSLMPPFGFKSRVCQLFHGRLLSELTKGCTVRLWRVDGVNLTHCPFLATSPRPSSPRLRAVSYKFCVKIVKPGQTSNFSLLWIHNVL